VQLIFRDVIASIVVGHLRVASRRRQTMHSNCAERVSASRAFRWLGSQQQIATCSAHGGRRRVERICSIGSDATAARTSLAARSADDNTPLRNDAL